MVSGRLEDFAKVSKKNLQKTLQNVTPMPDNRYMEQHLTDRIDSLILKLRFTGHSLDAVADMTESDRKLVRIREAAAMMRLRNAGFSDREIREHFEKGA